MRRRQPVEDVERVLFFGILRAACQEDDLPLFESGEPAEVMVKVTEPNPPQGLVGDIVGIRAESATGETHRILGTVYADGLPRILRIDNYNMDMVPEGNMIVILNKDMPGTIGTVGTTFGDAGVNIADMVISRDKHPDGSATALMLIKTDSDPSQKLLDALRSKSNILKAKSVTLPGRAG